MIPPLEILTTDNVFMKGAGALKDIPQLDSRFAVVDLGDMLHTDWEDDTHFVAYRTFGPDGQPLPAEEQFRLRKTILCEIENKGGSVRAWGGVFDWDLNQNVTAEELKAAGWDGLSKKLPKLTWTKERRQRFEEQLFPLVNELSDRNIGPAYVYLTNHGARMIHLYEQDVDVITHEQIIRGMISEYQKLGLYLDPACLDWTRLFRAPRVVRAGALTSKQAWFKSYQWDEWTVSTIAPREVVHADSYAAVPEYAGDQPTPEEALELLEDASTGRKTEKYKLLKNLLHRRDLGHICNILTGKDLSIPEGQRDATLTSYVGYLCAHTYPEAWSSPELVYAVLLPAAEQLEPDAGTPCWLSKLWGLCTRMWTREHAKGVQRQIEQEAKEEARQEGMEGLLTQVRKKYPFNRKLFSEDSDEALCELMRMGLLKQGSAIYVLRPDGYYTEIPCTGDLLPGVIKDLGMEFLMPIRHVGSRGGVTLLTGNDLLREYGRPIHRIVGIQGIEGAMLGEGSVLQIPLFKWDKHEPVHDQRVETWLQMMGGERWQELCRWIAYAQDMRRPICALALVGPRGVGKGLLARGLQELIQGAPVPASGSDLVSNFTPALLHTPFVIVDEGLSTDRNGVRDVADSFRRLVAGEPCRVNMKFMPEVEVQVPFRLMFTANNREIVYGLVGNRTLTFEDREAIAERIKYLELQGEAAVWLRQRGGRDFTAGWVGGDGPSDYVLARHFRWMYEHREELYGPPDADRLLVSGDMASTIVDDLRVVSGITPEVAKVCAHLVASRTLPSEVGDCIAEDEEGVWVTSTAIINQYALANLFDKRVRMNETSVGRALKNLCIVKYKNRKKTRAGNFRNLNWHLLDLLFLHKHACEHGLPTQRLEQILDKTYHEPSKKRLESI